MSVYLEENRNKKDNSENYSSKNKEVNDSLLLKKCLTNKFINRLFTLLLILLYLPFCMFIILLSPIYITAILIHKITNIDTKNTLYFIINFIFLGLYIFTKDLIWYILFAPQYIYNILYSIPNLKRSISYSIKENNYISLIILSICLVSTLVAVYGIPNQNNYILLWEGKILSFNNNILTFISYISLIIIALLFVIIFKKNEKILLWFNKNSNNFGTNWFIGLNFTTLVALITYVVISLLSSNVILQFDAEGVGNFLKGLVKIINVTEWSDITFLEQELTNWQYIFLFIGRIFVAYGYYQTIQAFRKFGKS
jgi:putative membrane protein